MQVPSNRRTNVERREQTVTALVDAARALFLEKGYAETGTPEIVKRAAVTRGALYHHFEDKLDLFRAVVRREADAVAAGIGGRTSTDMTPQEAMTAGADAYFEAMSVPGRAFLLLVEGPSVLGRKEMHLIDLQTGGETLRQGLAHMAGQAGGDFPVDETAALLSAMFDRAALAIAEGEKPEPYRQAIARLIGGLC